MLNKCVIQFQIYINIKILVNINFNFIYLQMAMYSNYLTDVGKLVYIIGQIQTTSSFKKMLDSNNDAKTKFFFKCVDELPAGAYKKIKVECRRKGILRCDWFNKILDRSPMMIFMVFNYCQPLDHNEKWEDRLSMTIKKINKVAEILRSSNKQQIILRVIIIISKQAVLQTTTQAGNVIQKISTFLKNYERELSIYQSDQLAKQVSKNKSVWFSMLDKAYERKHRAINKRKEQSFGERRLGCLVKMAVISEIISKKDSYSQYEEAYRSLHFRFIQTMKNKVEIYNFDAIRELKTMADIVLLRKLIVKISISNNFTSVPESISNHMKYFYQNSQNDNFFFSYQNMIWRQNFLQNLLEVLYTNDHIEIIPKSYFAQILNAAISFSYKLCRANKQIQPILANMEVKGRIIPTQAPVYIGSRNYTMGIQIVDADVIWTQMNELMDKKKDFVTRGLQTITRYKSMKIFRKHEVSFFNIFLLRFYLADQKFGSIGGIFNEIIKLKISEYDFYSLNYLIDELQKQSEKSQQHRILIHSLAVLIADYFKNTEQLQKYGSMLMSILPNKLSKSDSVDLLNDSQQTNIVSQNTTEKDPFILPLPNQSNTFAVEVQFQTKIHQIEKPLQFVVIPKFNNKFLAASNKTAILRLFFNKTQIKCERLIHFKNMQKDNKIVININPLQYFTKDQQLSVQSAVLIIQSNPQIHLLVQNISFGKYKSILLVTKLKIPQITIKFPYQIYYINQISKFIIDVAKVDDKSVKVQIKFSVNEDPSNDTEVFMNTNDRLNLVNSNCFQNLHSTQQNIVFMRCNKLGTRVLKFLFEITITQHIGNKELKDHHAIVKELGFRVINLFKTLKLLKQSFTGNEIKAYQIPPNKNIIMSYQLRAVQTINVIELGQHKSPKPCFKTHKDVQALSDFIISPEERLKNIYIFEVKEEELKPQDKKQLFLISFYVKWSRIDMDLKLGLLGHSEQIINLYNQDDVKISLKSDKVEVQYQQGKTLRKKHKQTLSVKYRNLTNDRIHVYSMMDNSQSILRIGNRGKDVDLGPKEIKTITFQILPVKSGYYKYPYVRSYFDGIEAKEKACGSIICVV